MDILRKKMNGTDHDDVDASVREVAREICSTDASEVDNRQLRIQDEEDYHLENFNDDSAISNISLMGPVTDL